MTKHYTFAEAKRMTGQNLLDELGIKSTGVCKTFVVNGGDRWTAWMTMGRGKQHGRFYVHIETKMAMPIVDSDGRPTGSTVDDVMHFRGRPSERVGNFKPV